MPHLSRLLAALLLPFGAAAAAQTTHTVLIDGMQFKPAIVKARAGDTIVWRNKDIVPHTVTATSAKVESGDIAMEKSWTYAARRAGTVDYICRFHPMMKAKIVVTK